MCFTAERYYIIYIQRTPCHAMPFHSEPYTIHFPIIVVGISSRWLHNARGTFVHCHSPIKYGFDVTYTLLLAQTAWISIRSGSGVLRDVARSDNICKLTFLLLHFFPSMQMNFCSRIFEMNWSGKWMKIYDLLKKIKLFKSWINN